MSMMERLQDVLAGNEENHILPFFWQHGEDEAVLRHYMRVIHEANIGAVCVESRPHPDFLGPKWWSDMDAILDEAQKLGMKVWILDDEHFPTGYAAGALENAPAALCHQYMDYNTVEVCGPKPGTALNVLEQAKPKAPPPWMPKAPPPKRVFLDDHLYRVLACPVLAQGALGKPIDLTDKVRDGWLAWDVPEGYWRVYIVYLTRDAKGRNDYINLIDRASCRLLIDTVYEPHYARYKDLFGSVIAGFFSDEPPIGNSPGYTPGDLIGNPNMPLIWSSAMPERMAQEYGEDWQLAIPALWAQGGDAQETARIRVAYMNAVSKLVSECFSEQIGRWCEERGVDYIGHMLEDCDANANLGPSMGHFFRGLSGQHMAGIDNIGGQVLIGGQNAGRRMGGGLGPDDAGFYQYTLGRLGASMAAIDALKKGRCMCENYGAYGWQIGVRTEKYLTDHFLARGVNFHVPHAFSPKAFPDPDCPPHFYAHGENPQYRAFGELMRYTNRVSHLIDGGKCEAPVALLYHGESRWAGAYESNIAACRELTRNQIGFVIIPADVFEHTEAYGTAYDADARTLRVNGLTFGALVISGCDYLTLPAARYAADMSAQGFPVVFTERTPVGVSDTDAATSAALAAQLAGCPAVATASLSAHLDTHIHRDAVLSTAFENLTVYHYASGGDVYLFLNEDPVCRFEGDIRIDAKGPVVRYDAWGNRLYTLPATQEAASTRLTLSLEPLEMAIILCGDHLPAAADPVPFGASERVISVPSFEVTRCAAKDYPRFTSPEAADLRHGMGPAHPEFSGFYRYEATVALPGHTHAQLAIDDVYETAEVFVNGTSAGLLTAPPYRFDVSALSHEGENHIAIEVATTLERKVAAMGVDTACMNKPAPLSPTGIVGQVQMRLL